MSNKPPDVDELLRGADLLVTVGSGGVGKTTVSAALGLRAALSGSKVLVITIDPARRLATSLGLEETGNRIVEVKEAVPEGDGSLSALMLDARTTFDELILRIASDERVRSRILSNRIYRLLSESIAGSHNVMAAEKLHEVMSEARYDLVVLDTPPTSNALDFLESSGYLARFLDDRVMGFFLRDKAKPTMASRLLDPARTIASRLLSTLFGRTFMDELVDFFEAFGGLYRGFRERAEEVRRFLRRPSTAFAVVCTPRALSLNETRRLADQLESADHPVRAWFVNQHGPYPHREPQADGRLLPESDRRNVRRITEASLPDADPDAVLDGLEAAYARNVARSDADADTLRRFGPDPDKVEVHTLPRLHDEVVELDSLRRFARLFDAIDLADSQRPG